MDFPRRALKFKSQLLPQLLHVVREHLPAQVVKLTESASFSSCVFPLPVWTAGRTECLVSAVFSLQWEQTWESHVEHVDLIC